tara:strand:+ start:416 stop:1372 length:957 start_codon:yes stop_codon:yes gene_type:complete
MIFIQNIIRKCFTFLSFPQNLKKEQLTKQQYKIIDYIYLKAKIFFYKNSNTLQTHKIFSKKVLNIILAKSLKNFLQLGFIQKMFFVHNRIYLFNLLKKLTQSREGLFWKKLLKEDSVGNPVPYFLERSTSGNLIRQVYLLKKFVDFSKINLQKIENVIEVGGGYGCLAKIFYKINPKINYTIFDTYEVNLLQYYYLNSLNIKSTLGTAGKISLVCSIKDLTKKVNSLKIKKNNTLYTANWSLSEMPLSLRKKLLFLLKKTNFSMVAFQDIFEHINNVEYFKKTQSQLGNHFNYSINEFREMNFALTKRKNFILFIKND